MMDDQFDREGNSNTRRHTIHVLVATDGSKYGQWGLNWVTALHVLDRAWLRGPFRTRPEILRVVARSARTLKKAKQQLAALKLKGTVRKAQGAVAPVIMKHAPKRDGLLVVSSQGLDALDRFTLGSVSTRVVQHATCAVLVVRSQRKKHRGALDRFPGVSSGVIG